MTDSKTLRKIKKLLNLANAPSATEGEAANAAAAAQSLMTKHQIDEIALEMDERVVDEVIKDWEDPLEGGTRLAAWKGQLAMAIAAVNACHVYRDLGELKIIGEQRDAQSVRYLYAYLVREIDTLAKRYGGNGRTWLNNWRHGVVDTLRKRLREARDEAIQEQYADAGTGTSLIVVDNALAVVKQRQVEVERIARQLGLRPGSRSGSRFNHSARNQGRSDGHGISLGTGNGQIGAGHLRLPS